MRDEFFGEARRVFEHGQGAWEIFIGTRDKAYSLELKSHEFEDGMMLPPNSTTIIKTNEQIEILKALAQALQDMGLYPKNDVAAELKATKINLDDMRDVVKKLFILASQVKND